MAHSLMKRLKKIERRKSTSNLPVQLFFNDKDYGSESECDSAIAEEEAKYPEGTKFILFRNFSPPKRIGEADPEKLESP